MRIVCLVVVLLVAFSGTVTASIYTREELEAYKSSGEIRSQVIDNIRVAVLTKIPQLEGGLLKGVAISPGDKIGLLINDAPNTYFNDSVVVLDENLEFVYGYQIDAANTTYKGGYGIFFLDEDTLCWCYEWENALCVMDPSGRGVTDIYRAKDIADVFRELDIKVAWSGSSVENMRVAINHDPSSKLKIVSCEKSKLVVAMPDGDPMVVYDRSQVYERRLKNDTTGTYIPSIAMMIWMALIATYFFLREKNNNRFRL